MLGSGLGIDMRMDTRMDMNIGMRIDVCWQRSQVTRGRFWPSRDILSSRQHFIVNAITAAAPRAKMLPAILPARKACWPWRGLLATDRFVSAHCARQRRR